MQSSANGSWLVDLKWNYLLIGTFILSELKFLMLIFDCFILLCEENGIVFKWEIESVGRCTFLYYPNLTVFRFFCLFLFPVCGSSPSLS